MELEATGKERQRAKMKAKVSMRSQSVKRVLNGEMASLTKPNLETTLALKGPYTFKIPPSSPFASQAMRLDA